VRAAPAQSVFISLLAAEGRQKAYTKIHLQSNSNPITPR
jgi:hypothetical protein